MLSEQRQYEITELICREGKASISELAEAFNVSCETIRRDLITIGKGNIVRKVHGGAIAVRHSIRDESYAARQVQSSHSKQKIGERSALLIEDNDIVGLDSGTCAEALARSIKGVNNVTFVVHSLPIANILADKIASGEITGSIIILNGTVNPETRTISGMTTLMQLKNYHLNKAFVASTAISEEGFMAGSEADGEFSLALIHQSDVSYVIAESEKIGKKSFYRLAEFYEVNALITDSENPINYGIKKRMTESGMEIICV